MEQCAAEEKTQSNNESRAEDPGQNTILRAEKGDGPVRTNFPGLEARPSISADDVKLLDDALQKLGRKKIPDEPAPGQPGPRTMDPSSIPDDPFEPPVGAPEGYRDRQNLRIAVEPWVEITSDGKARLKWEMWVATPPSFVHFGLDVPDQILDYPRYRKASREGGAIDEFSKSHSVQLTLSRMETHLVDIVGLGDEGGTIAYRIEFLDTVGGITLFYDGRFAFVKDGDEYKHGVTFKEGPIVDLPRPDGMTVSFETDVSTRGAVLVVPSDGDPMVFESEDAGTHHEIEISGLEPDTLYAYRAGAVDARAVIGWRGDYAFRTAPEETRPFRFAVMSDSRAALGGGERMMSGANNFIVRRFATDALRLGADMILFPGDLVNGYTTEVRELEMQLESWKSAMGPVHRYIPVFEGMGNHDVTITQKSGSARHDKAPPNSSEDVFAREFVNPTNGPPPEREGLPPYKENVYSFDYGKVHFVSINTNYWTASRPGELGNREGYIMDRQLEWLEQDLKKARDNGASFIFVYTHEPGYPNGGHVGDGMYWRGRISSMNERRVAFWTLMSQYEVAAVFHGDEHNYSRLLIDEKMDPAYTNPVWQIVTGGCGAPYYSRSRTPWQDRVVKFSPQEHFVMVDVLSDEKAAFTVFGRNGETLDEFVIEREHASSDKNPTPGGNANGNESEDGIRSQDASGSSGSDSRNGSDN